MAAADAAAAPAVAARMTRRLRGSVALASVDFIVLLPSSARSDLPGQI